ncbi:4-hydroxy-3-methylbut-2-enyl diphosphate reductase [Jatrophihabitans sp. DSM 45814]
MTPGLVVVAALRIEALALKRGLGEDAAVVHAGIRATKLNANLRSWLVESANSQAPNSQITAVALAGVGGAVGDTLRPGDIVVASEIRDDQGTVELPAAAPLVAELRAMGFTVRRGPIFSSTKVVHGSRRAEIAASGAIAVDMESGPVVRAVLAEFPGAPLAVVRVVVDTPDEPLVRMATLASGTRALRILSQLGPALDGWSASVSDRQVLLAAPRSFCAGVERAIDIVERALARYPAPIYVRRQIVHNAHVVASLERKGAVFVEELEEIPDAATVILSAHGVAPAVRDEAAKRQMRVIDATCPLVAKVHTETRRFLAHGDTVLLIGHDGHDETEGTLGEGPGRVLLVENSQDASTIEVPDPDHLAYVTQTTLAVGEAERVAATLRQRFPAISAPPTDDICFATTNRQNAVRAIAADADVVLVVGSHNSSNSKRLVEVAVHSGAQAHLVEDVESIRPGWIRGAATVGVTAGASAPPHLVDEVIKTLGALGQADVSTIDVAREEVTFTLPKEVDS